jgi:uncharacterized membrane protein
MKNVSKAVLFILLFLFTALPSFAQSMSTPPETDYLRATVIEASEPKLDDDEIQGVQYSQIVTVEITEGEDKGKVIEINNSFLKERVEIRTLTEGEKIILTKTTLGNDTTYTVYDRYRLTSLYFIIAGFFALVIIAAGRKGVGSLVGLGISFAVLMGYIVPQILEGGNPLFISITGSIVIVLSTIYLAHGFSQRTTVALAATLISLVITGLLAIGMVNILGLTGLGSEEAYSLTFSNTTINLQGLLLGGIIIGVLGVLDDVTTTQSATVFALAKANEKWQVKHLFREGYAVGREHITSLVNTLVLAYAGASLPIFLFFIINPLNQPWWLILNSEMITEEIVRTLAGSIGLFWQCQSQL